MSMVKALTEIVSVDIGENLVSMSVVQKQNESGIKFNQRLFIVVHGVFFGYMSKVKMNEQPAKLNIAEAKVKIPMKNLYSIDVEKEIMTVKFTVLESGKLIPKEWVLKTASDKLANFWKQLLEYELKMRNKSPPTKRASNSSVKQKQPQSNPLEQSSRARIQNQNKRNESSSPSKPTPPKQDYSQKKSIELKPSAKVFENPLFDGDDSDEERQKSKKKTQQKKKPAAPATKPIQKPEEPPKKVQEPKQVPSPEKVEEKREGKNENKESEQKKKQIPQLNLQKIQEQQNEDSPNIGRSRLRTNSPKGFPKPQKSPQKPAQKSSSQNPPPEKPSQEKSVPQRSASIKPLPEKVSPTKTIQRPVKQQQKKPQKIDIGIKESQFINGILKQLDQRNEKYPFQQLIYNHEDVQKIVKLYGKELNEASNEKKKTQMLLNYILEAQKEKMKRSISKLKISNESPWMYKQIVADQQNNLISFSHKCKTLMKILYSELQNRQYFTFVKTKQEKGVIYFEIGEIEIKVPLIGHKNSPKQSNIKLLDDSVQKMLKKEFKYLKYLYKIIKNEGRIRVPYCCLCEYGGIIALFKIKGVLGDKQKILEEIDSDIKTLQSKSVLPLQKIIKSKLRALKQFYYNELRQGETTQSFKYCIASQVQNLFICDLNALNPSHQHQLRMELVQEQSNQILPYKTNEDLQYSNNRQQLKILEKLGDNLTLRVNKAIQRLNDGSFYFISPSELTQFLHTNGINMRYLKQIHMKLNDQFTKSLFASEMASRSIKIFFRKTLQDECFEGFQLNAKKYSEDEHCQQLKDKCIDFFNCLFGSGAETDALWALINKNIEEKFQLTIHSKDELNKGQLLASVAYHCNIDLNWAVIDANEMFTTNQFLKKENLKEVYIRVKTFEPIDSSLKKDVEEKIKEVSYQNFAYITKRLKLKQQKFPKDFQLFSNFISSIKLYLGNFIEPQQLDWSNNYSHLSVYQSLKLSVYSFKTDLNLIRWHLKSNRKQKYLNAFNEFTKKISRLYGNNHPLLSELYQLFSQHHKAKGQAEDSINFMKSSLLNYSAIYGDNNLKVAQSYYKLATLYVDFKRWYEAQQYLQKAKQIMSHLRLQKSLLQAKIRLSLALIYFKDDKHKQCLDLISSKTEVFDQYEANTTNSYEAERTQVYQLLYYCQAKTNSKIENIKLAQQLSKKLDFFKNHDNYSEILYIIIETYMNNLNKQAKQTMNKLINMIPTKISINFYKKSYDLLQRRYREKNLFESFKKYTENAVKIVDLIIQKNLLKVWQNLQKVYERQTLFDFISLVQELIYFLGRDRLNTI